MKTISIEFASIVGTPGTTGPTCNYTITIQDNWHVELACSVSGGSVAAYGEDGKQFLGTGPAGTVDIIFTPAVEEDRMICRVGTVERYENLGALNGTESTIQV